MIEKFTAWFIELVIKFFKSLWDFVTDILIFVVEQLLTAVVALLGAIPVPDFLTQYSLTSILSSIPADAAYFVGILRLPEAFLLIGSAFAFRMIRKVVTLFQW